MFLPTGHGYLGGSQPSPQPAARHPLLKVALALSPLVPLGLGMIAVISAGEGWALYPGLVLVVVSFVAACLAVPFALHWVMDLLFPAQPAFRTDVDRRAWELAQEFPVRFL
jgi:hypothetical protein